MKKLVLLFLLSSAVAQCGRERWPVKTLQDSTATQIATQPTDSSVSQLIHLPAPHGKQPQDTRVAPVETTLYRIHAFLKGYKQEADGDLHVVIGDLDDLNVTMVVEIPKPECANKQYSERWDNMRILLSTMGTARVGKMVWFVKPIQVEIWGVGFFDFLHGQTGMAKNGIELHPLMYLARETE